MKNEELFRVLHENRDKILCHTDDESRLRIQEITVSDTVLEDGGAVLILTREGEQECSKE